MPWCPECRTEYREGVARCADCGSPLVDDLPPEPGRGEAEELEAAAERHSPQQDLAPGCLSGLHLFVWSARRTRRMGALWLTLGALAVVTSILTLAAWTRMPGTARPASPMSVGEYARTGAHAFWWDWTPLSSLLRNLPRGLTRPLDRSLTIAPGRAVSYLATLSGAKRGAGRAVDWLFYAAELLVDALLLSPLLAGIYGWILAGVEGRPLTMRIFGRSVKHHWRALVAWGVLVSAVTLLTALVYPMPKYGADAYWAARGTRSALITWLCLPFALAPFVIVAQERAVLPALRWSFRLMRAQWRRVLALVVLYRAVCALLTFLGFPMTAIWDNLWHPVFDTSAVTLGARAGIAAGLALVIAEHLAWIWLQLTLCTALLALALPGERADRPGVSGSPLAEPAV